MSRRVYLLGVGLALVALAFIVTDTLLWRPGVTEANVRRIRAGMTVTEVAARLGGPGAPIWDGAAVVSSPATPPSPPTGYLWCSDAGALLVWADEDGRVQRASWMPSRHASPGLLERLRAWLGW
jgi:hypothetical protein